MSVNKKVSPVKYEVSSSDPILMRDYLDYLGTIRGASTGTLRSYRYDLRLLMRFLLKTRGLVTTVDDTPESFQSIDISHVDAQTLACTTLDELHAFLSHVGRNRLNSARTRSRKVTCLKSFFLYLTVKAKKLSYNPTEDLDSPKVVRRRPRYLNLEESSHLLGSIDGRLYERDYAIMTLFLHCGLRLTELTGINLDDVRNDLIVILGKGDKERTLYLNDACRFALDAYLMVRPTEHVIDKEALFLSEWRRRMCRTTIQHIVKKHLTAAGLDTRRYSPHKLRHTAATLMYLHGNVDIRALQEILGHEHITATEIYVHLDEKRLRRAVESNPLSQEKTDG